MSSLAFSTFDSCDNKKPAKGRNKTYKRRKAAPSKKAATFLNSMPMREGLTTKNHDESTPEHASRGTPILTSHGMEPSEVEGFEEVGTDYNTPTHPESFGLLKEGLDQQKKYHAEQNQYYNQYVPSYTGTPQNVPYYSQLLDTNNLQNTAPDELMKKLNYVVHLLEEQHDEKTGSVTEELVLYMFLGVFVIFIVDSFSRSGKYKR